MTESVVIIGGGIGGLATAALLARGGAAVTLLERHDRLGGRAGLWEQDGFRFDTGPSWYFMPEVFEHFFALMGEKVDDHLDLVKLDPAYRLFPEPDGQGPSAPVELPADPDAVWQLVESMEPGAGDAVRAYGERASDAYRMALDHFLYTTFARPDRAISPEVAARFPTLARLLTEPMSSAIARTVEHPVLRQMLGYHAVFLGSSPYRVPALYTLMSHLDLVEGVRYPRGGFVRVIEAIAELARRAGADLRTGVEVSEVMVEPVTDLLRPRRTGRATGVLLADGSVIKADHVVHAGDLHHLETTLLAEQHRSKPERWWQDKGPGISSLLVMAGVRGELPELAHHSLFFTSDWPANFEAILGRGRSTRPSDLAVPDPASIYVSRVTATEPEVAPAGHEALFVLVPFPADPAIGAGPGGRAELDALADRYLDQIGAWAGIPDLRGRTVVRKVVGPADFAADFSAWRGTSLGMEHTLAQSAMFRPGNVSPTVAHLLHVGGTTIPGVGLPMCLISAELVTKRLLGETSANRLPEPLRPGFLDAARPRGLWGRAGA